MIYTALDQVTSDFVLYLTISQGAGLTLSMFPQLAKIRWPWIVANWDQILYPQFVSNTQGDDFLKGVLASMAKDVRVVQLGAAYNPFEDAIRMSKYKSLLDLITITSLGLSIDEQIYINEEVARIQALTVTDFKAMASYIRTECAIASQRIGLGDDDGVAVLGVGTVTVSRQYNLDDLKVIDASLELADIIDGVVFALNETVEKTPDLLTAANLNISTDSTVRVNDTYVSSVAVPFETSLEYMAGKYLGSVSRWFEIATVNNLQAPFTDLSGVKLYLLATGSGSTVRVNDSIKEQMPVGTRLRIGSARYQEENRYVEKTVDNKDGTLTIELSGDSDLAKFKVSEMSFIRIFKPNTVNETSLVLVPTDVSARYPKQKIPNSDALRRLDQSLLRFGVDIKRDEASGDVSIAAGGDFDLVFGVAAVRQALLYVLKTAQSELPWHVRYGITSQIGDAWAGGVDDGFKFSEILQASLEQDPRYSSVILRDIKATPTSIALDFLVTLEGSSTVIPLSFIG